MTSDRVISDAQEFLRQEGIPAWLVHDYRHSNPIFPQVIPPSGHVTRPSFLFIPAKGVPTLLTHHVDAGKFTGSQTNLSVYRNRWSLEAALRELLVGIGKVAMEYSPRNELPRVSRVDAGTVELVRSLGAEVVSSADLMQYATQRWTPEQLAGHRRAAEKLGMIVNEAFRRIGERLAGEPGPTGEKSPTEFEIAEFIRQRFRGEGLEAADGPIVSVNAHCSDPHYEPEREGSSVFQAGDWVLIDLWAREADPDAVYADITWTAFVGGQVPARHQEIFDIVTGARDAALEHLQESHRQGRVLQGWEADAVARRYIEERGYGEYFTHRLGHSISYEVHGEAVNLDGFETHDTRRIIPGIGFSIEPGIYLPEFGVRSEIDAFMSEEGPYATSPVQREVVLIGGS